MFLFGSECSLLETNDFARGWRFLIRGALAIGLLMLLCSCAPGLDLPPLPQGPAETYHLGAGDVVRVITFGNQQMTAEFRVSDSGNVAIPLLGNVHAAGLSTTELESTISQQLVQKDIFRDPSVSVEVISYRPIFVLGEVAKPGQYPYQPGMTVLTAVAVAGGFTYRAVENYAAVVRQIESHAVEGRAARQTLVLPGDVITIFERRF